MTAGDGRLDFLRGKLKDTTVQHLMGPIQDAMYRVEGQYTEDCIYTILTTAIGDVQNAMCTFESHEALLHMLEFLCSDLQELFIKYMDLSKQRCGYCGKPAVMFTRRALRCSTCKA